MRTIHVSIRHDHHFVVAQFADIKLVAPDPCAQRSDQVGDLLGRQHLVKSRPFDVQDFTTKWQHRLVFPRTALLGRPTSGVTLHQEHFGFRWIPFLTIRQFTGQRCTAKRRLAPCQLARFARRFTCQCRFDNLGDNVFRLNGVFFKPLCQLFVHQTLNGGAHLRRNQLVFGLRGELRVRHFHAEHAGQAFTRVITAERDFLFLRDARALGIIVDRPRQCPTKARHMRTAIALWNVVCERKNILVIAVVPPHGHFNPDVIFFAHHINRLGQQTLFGPIKEFHKLLHTTLIFQNGFQMFGGAFIAQNDLHARV